MERLFHNFTGYLCKIGLITPSTSNELYKIYNNIIHSAEQNSNINNIDFKEAVCATLIYFFSSLKEDIKKEMSLNLVLNYFSFIEAQKKSKLKTCILLFTEKTKNKALLKKYLKWNYMSQNNSSSIVKTRHIPSYSHNNFMTSSNTLPSSNTLIDDNNNSMNRPIHLETSWDRKEREDFEKCTFKPKTNNYGNLISNSKRMSSLHTFNNDNSSGSVYERLYKDGEKYAIKKQMKALELDHILSEKYNFQPELIHTPQKFRKKSLNKFDERQENFINNKSKHKDQIITQVNDEFNNKCSFSPQINKTKKYNKNQRSTSPAHIRLYEDDKRRRNKNIRIKNEINQKIDEQCNSFITKKTPVPAYGFTTTNTNSNSKNNSVNYDSKKIEKLYKAYKSKTGRIEQIKKEMESESGITFQPYLYKDNKYYSKITSNLYERGDKMLETKKNFVNLFNQAQTQNWKEQQIGYKEYSQQEKEQITQRIINRLYGGNYKLPSNHNEIKNTAQKNFEKENLERNIDSDVILSNDNVNTEENLQEDYYNNEGNNVIEDDNDEKYNDKIISIDEYTFGKNKKKKLAIENNMEGSSNGNRNAMSENFLNSNPSIENGSLDDIYKKIHP